MSRSGGIIEYVLPNPLSFPSFITLGPDGEITEYEIPTASAEPHGIAISSSGEIWFAEECDKIGRLRVSG
ncbi:NHL repeat-containing protein [Paenibacillus tarimensis]|uniref:hypothetical protein n=1 Tax=Paenibacillus tarimensis TaxID=416012 RepID=UPI001F192DB3|nr:hypothetical protein [Paenibacillus tarimensis]MCF2943453.1 hypothetical protein [Paenibacillus tarimensis]